MKNRFTINRQFQTRRRRSNPRQVLAGTKQTASIGRIPRISRLMALAIRFDQLIRDGVVTDQAELSKLGHVSRARLTQVMNLLNLSPEIQQHLLDLSGTEWAKSKYSERRLRTLSAELNWSKQRQMFRHRSSDT